jgi:hypothetical protein
MDSIGYFDACHFFVGFEDYDYARRALQAKLTIIAVDSAEVRHPDLQRKKAMQEALPKSRDESQPDAVINRLRPEHLGYVTNRSRAEPRCAKNRSLLTFSWLYFLTKSLSRWQFAIAFLYSLCMLSINFARENEICVKKTLNAYVKCLASNVRKEWPYGCVEEFCRHILE